MGTEMPREEFVRNLEQAIRNIRAEDAEQAEQEEMRRREAKLRYLEVCKRQVAVAVAGAGSYFIGPDGHSKCSGCGGVQGQYVVGRADDWLAMPKWFPGAWFCPIDYSTIHTSECPVYQAERKGQQEALSEDGRG